ALFRELEPRAAGERGRIQDEVFAQAQPLVVGQPQALDRRAADDRLQESELGARRSAARKIARDKLAKSEPAGAIAASQARPVKQVSALRHEDDVVGQQIPAAV